MKKLIILILALLPLWVVAQTTYTVSNTDGGADYASIAALEAAMSGFNSGDTIKIRRGDVFNENFNITVSNLYITTYDTGIDPIISGLTEATTWATYSGNIYYHVLSSSLDEIRFLTIDDIDYVKGRTPNGELNFDTITSSTGNDNFYDEDRTEPDGYWVDATVVFKESAYDYPAWSLHRGLVSSFASNVFTFNTCEYGVGAGYPYFITDHVNTLDLHGEWAYNNDTLWVYLDNTAANYTINYSSIDNLVTVSADSCVFNNMSIEYSNLDAFSADDIDSVAFINGKINYAQRGVVLNEANNSYFEYDTIMNCVTYGIRYGGGDGIYFGSNVVLDVASNFTTAEDIPYGGGLAGLMLSYKEDELPYLYPQNFNIEKNIIQRTGGGGIQFYRTGNGYVQKNSFIDNVLIDNDNGSIYLWKVDTITEANVTTLPLDSVVIANNYLGFTSDSMRFKAKLLNGTLNNTFGNYGIYPDDWSSNLIIRNNLIRGTRFGIFLHSGWNNLIKDNIIICDSVTTQGIRHRTGGGSVLSYSGQDESYEGNIVTSYWNGVDSYNVGYWGQNIADNFYFSGNYWMLLNTQAPLYGVDDNVLITTGTGAGNYSVDEFNALTFSNTSNEIDVNGRDNKEPFSYDQSQLTDIDSVPDAYYNFSENTHTDSYETTFGAGYYYYDEDGNDMSGAMNTAPYETDFVLRSAVPLSLSPPDTAQVFNVTSTKRDTINVVASGFDETVNTVRLVYKLGSESTTQIDGTALIETSDTTEISGEYRINAPTDTLYYISLWHQSTLGGWNNLANRDTVTVDSVGSGSTPSGSGCKAVIDTFPDNGSLDDYDNWTVSNGTLTVSSEEVRGDYQWTSHAVYTDYTFNNDQCASVVFSDIAASNGVRSGPVVRHNGGATESASNCYFIHCWGTGYNLVKKQGETYTDIVAGGTVSLSSLDTVRLEVEGTTLRMYKNGVQFGSDQTDSDLVSGSAGLTVFGNSSGSNTVTTFYSGNLEDTPPVNPCDTTTIVSSSTVTDVTCNGGSDGTITIDDIYGGTGVYTFLWNDDNTDRNRTGLSFGNYSVIISDENNCNTIVNYTVNEPDAISISATTIPSTGNDGVITLTVTGGLPPYTYLWSNGATTKDITGLAPGYYSVIVTDDNSCTAYDTTKVGYLLTKLSTAVDGDGHWIADTLYSKIAITYNHSINLYTGSNDTIIFGTDALPVWDIKLNSFIYDTGADTIDSYIDDRVVVREKYNTAVDSVHNE